MKSVLSTCVMLLLLTACATAPTAPVQVLQACPKLPALDPLPDGVLEHDFIGTMQQLLQGNLPWPPSYKLTSEPVSASTTKRGD